MSAFTFEDCPIPTYLNFSDHTGGSHRANKLFLFFRATTTLGIKDWVNEPLGITNELKITSQVLNFIKTDPALGIW
jgi:hypothetical protein